MNIKITAKPFGNYCVEADGKVIEPDARYADLPAIIDRMYEGRESVLAAQLELMAEELNRRAECLDHEVHQLREQAADVLELCRKIWGQRYE